MLSGITQGTFDLVSLPIRGAAEAAKAWQPDCWGLKAFPMLFLSSSADINCSL